jgi:hypothetical protein
MRRYILHPFPSVALLLLLTLPALVQAQFNYTTNNGTITITGYTGPGGAVTIPDRINGLPVTRIGDEAFVNCYLTRVAIGNNVTSIGYGAFASTGLTSITIPDSVTSIGQQAFESCYYLTSVTIGNGVTSIAFETFDVCDTLTNLNIGNSVTSIGYGAFGSCDKLTSVTIPDSVTSIGGEAFYYCTSLTSVYFQGNAPSADSSVFDYDSNATVYFLPGTAGWDSVTWFGGIPAVQWNPRVQTSGASFGVRTNRFGFTITGTTNIPIVVEASTNLPSASWTPLRDCTLTNGSIYFSDPQWTNYPTRYYRIRSP